MPQIGVYSAAFWMLYFGYSSVGPPIFVMKGPFIGNTSIGFVGAPFRKGQDSDGPQMTSKLFRRNNLTETIRLQGCAVNDFGDIDFEDNPKDDLMDCGKGKNSYSVSDAVLRTETRIKEILRENNLPIVIGGDHTVTIGAIQAMAAVHPNLTVLLIDAHADVETVNDTKSGNFKAMIVAFMDKDLENSSTTKLCPAFKDFKGLLNVKNMAYIGVRGLDEREKEAITNRNLLAFDVDTVRSLGVNQTITQILDTLNPNRSDPIYVSFSLDSLDPTEAPSIASGSAHGLTKDELKDIGKSVASLGLLVGLDITDINSMVGSSDEAKKSTEESRDISAVIDIIYSFVSNRCKKCREDKSPDESQQL